MLNGKFTIYPILGPSVCPSQVIFVNISIAYKIFFSIKKEVVRILANQLLLTEYHRPIIGPFVIPTL